MSVAKTTGGVRLVGPEVRLSVRGREENKSVATSVEKAELNPRAIEQLLLLPF